MQNEKYFSGTFSTNWWVNWQSNLLKLDNLYSAVAHKEMSQRSAFAGQKNTAPTSKQFSSAYLVYCVDGGGRG